MPTFASQDFDLEQWTVHANRLFRQEACTLVTSSRGCSPARTVHSLHTGPSWAAKWILNLLILALCLLLAPGPESPKYLVTVGISAHRSLDGRIYFLGPWDCIVRSSVFGSKDLADQT
jgi:hypothetical protein